MAQFQYPQHTLIYEFACAYLRLGISLFPTRKATKIPLMSWKEFQYRQPSPAEVEGWIRKWGTINLTAVTGEISGIVAVDLDGPAGRATAEAYGGFEKTPCVSSGREDGGSHYYFARPPFATSNFGHEEKEGKPAVFPGIDYKGDGGCITLPPSIHKSGKPYEWIVAPNGKWAPLPDWVANHARKPEKIIVATEDRYFHGACGDYREYANTIVRNEIGTLRATSGGRNDALNRCAYRIGRLVGAGMIHREDVEPLISYTASEIGLQHGEAKDTIKSGLDAGECNPKPYPTPKPR